jgi:hypothetical protein
MRKRFVVLLSPARKPAHDKFLAWVRKAELSWWHWMNGSWLLVDTKGQHTASEIRDAVTESFGNARCLVLELRGEDDTWSGSGPARPKKNMFDWVRRAWRAK